MYDFAIVGAGIAGASLAAGLAGKGTVLMLEAEDRPGYHATGRSAAFWTESYGGPLIQPLTTASFGFLERNGLLADRGGLTLARADEAEELERFAQTFEGLGVRVERLDRAELEVRLPGVKSEWTCGAYEPDCRDIDVAGLHQLYLTQANRKGAELWLRAELAHARQQHGGWDLAMADGRSARSRVLINAAGAWADVVAQRAGLASLGIEPLRRTVVQLRMNPPASNKLPLVMAHDGSFYFKPERGKLWLSPHDEVPSPPCDAAPEEIDVATAIHRFEQVIDWPIEALEHKWAGLRSFVPDRLPVYGFDRTEPGFFWFAGLGGFGIQTAPAAADLALRLLLGEPSGAIDPAPFSPHRFVR